MVQIVIALVVIVLAFLAFLLWFCWQAAIHDPVVHDVGCDDDN